MDVSLLIISPEAVSSRHFLEPFTGGNHAPRRLSQKEESGRFLKKAAQKFFYAGQWAWLAPTPMAQISKVFLLLFVHKKKPSLRFTGSFARPKRCVIHVALGGTPS